jgi:hypothetical protein
MTRGDICLVLGLSLVGCGGSDGPAGAGVAKHDEQCGLELDLEPTDWDGEDGEEVNDIPVVEELSCGCNCETDPDLSDGSWALMPPLAAATAGIARGGRAAVLDEPPVPTRSTIYFRNLNEEPLEVYLKRYYQTSPDEIWDVVADHTVVGPLPDPNGGDELFRPLASTDGLPSLKPKPGLVRIQEIAIRGVNSGMPYTARRSAGGVGTKNGAQTYWLKFELIPRWPELPPQCQSRGSGTDQNCTIFWMCQHMNVERGVHCLWDATHNLYSCECIADGQPTGTQFTDPYLCVGAAPGDIWAAAKMGCRFRGP